MDWVDKTGMDGVRGLLYGDSSQFMAQLLSAITCVVFGFVMAYVWFKLSNLITPLRVSPEVEVEGLDIPEMGAHGYADFQLVAHGGRFLAGDSLIDGAILGRREVRPSSRILASA